MSAPAQPTLTPNPDLLAVLKEGLKINISGSLPGETLMTAMLNYAGNVRATMDPALLKRYDAVVVQQIEDLQRVWRGIWVALGVLPRGE